MGPVDEILRDECVENVGRSAARGFKRTIAFYLAGSGVALAGLLVLELARNHSDAPARSLSAWFVEVFLPLVCLAAIPLVVVCVRLGVLTALGEGGYRTATWTEKRYRTEARWFRVLRPVAVVCVWVVLGAMHNPGDDFGWKGRAVLAVGLAASAGVIALGKRGYCSWRARRNARLVLEWERRFDSEARR